MKAHNSYEVNVLVVTTYPNPSACAGISSSSMNGAHGLSFHIMFLLAEFDVSLRTFSAPGRSRVLGLCLLRGLRSCIAAIPARNEALGTSIEVGSGAETRRRLPANAAKDFMSAKAKGINALLKVHASIGHHYALWPKNSKVFRDQ